MEADFWHGKWSRGETGFHKEEAHPLLMAHVDVLNLSAGARVFVPLCGMTLDIPWLHAQGYRVVGAELSQQGVEALFQRMGVTPDVAEVGAMTRYRFEGIEIFVGDVFDLSAEGLGPIDAIYDRAALVALPDEMRRRYAGHLATLSDTAPQLVITFDYDQSAMKGPPFSVPRAEVERLYGAAYQITSLASVPVEGGLKGKCPAMEEVWVLRGR